MNQYPTIVQQIHREFNTAGDDMIAEANRILDHAASKNIQKGKRLSLLGFGRVAEAVESKQIEESSTIAELQVKLIRMYSQKYPLYRFITPEKVNEICEKYNLVLGDVNRYIGFVPEKNVTEMENFIKFKIDEEDYQVLIDDGHYNWTESSYSIEDAKRIIGRSKLCGEFFTANERGGIICSTLGDNVALRGNVPTNFKICAPLKDMNIDGMEVVGRKLQNIPDPVVLAPVRGGYLIVTAWGDEASDPEIVNSKYN